MRDSILIIIIFLQSIVVFSQSDDYITSNIFGTKYYHTISIGISVGGEHAVGLPKVAYGFQNGKTKGMYMQIHLATALGFSLSPGVEVGYRYRGVGLGYSMSYLGIEHNKYFYKWTHNINAHLKLGSVLAKVGTPIYYSSKGPEFEDYKYQFIEYKKIPLNLELLYHSFQKKEM